MSIDKASYYDKYIENIENFLNKNNLSRKKEALFYSSITFELFLIVYLLIPIYLLFFTRNNNNQNLFPDTNDRGSRIIKKICPIGIPSSFILFLGLVICSLGLSISYATDKANKQSIKKSQDVLSGIVQLIFILISPLIFARYILVATCREDLRKKNYIYVELGIPIFLFAFALTNLFVRLSLIDK